MKARGYAQQERSHRKMLKSFFAEQAPTFVTSSSFEWQSTGAARALGSLGKDDAIKALFKGLKEKYLEQI